MDTWRVLTVVALATAVFGDGYRLMYKKVTRNHNLLRHSIKDINRLFSYFMPQTHCLQVETDGTVFGRSFQNELHQAEKVPPLVIGSVWSEVQGCRGFVVIATSFPDAINLLRSLPRWADHRVLVIIQDAGSNTLLMAILADPETFLDAEVAIVSSGNLTTGYRMTQPDRYYVSFSLPAKPWKRLENGPQGFNGVTLSVLTSNCSMFSQLGPIKPKGIPEWTEGAEMIMLKEIAKRLNLNLKFNATKSLKSSWFQKPLAERRTDIAFCGILVTAKNQNLTGITLSQPMTILCLKLLVPRPGAIQDEWDAVFRPFSPGLWLLIAIISFVTTFLLQRVTFATRRLVLTERIKKYEQLGGSFLQVLSILVLSDVPRSSRQQGAIRHLLTWWSVFTLVMTTSFSSSLISHLTNKDFTKKLDSVQELVKNDFHWAMQTEPEFRDIFDHSDEWQQKWSNRFERVYSTAHHVMLLKKGKQALWGYEVYGGFSLPDSDLPDDVLQNFEVSSQCFMEYFIGFAMRKGSPFELPIKRYIHWYNEGGLVNAIVRWVHARRYLNHTYVYKVLQVTQPRSGRVYNLKISHLKGIFIIWISGILVSVVVFLLEVAQKCWI